MTGQAGDGADVPQRRTVSMTTEGETVEFIDDDAGYVAWISHHPRGFVLNCV
jgi:hypothetical protein